MMGDENLLPEERLFKAIQQEKMASGQGQKAPGGITKDAPARRTAGLGIGPSLLNVVQQKIFAKGAEKKDEETKKSFAFLAQWQDIDFIKTFLLTGINLTIVNRGLVIMIAALTALTIHYVVNSRLTMAGLMSSIAQVKFDAARPRVIETFQPLNYYLDQVRSRDVFNPVAERVESPVVVEQAPPPPPPKPKLHDMANGLKIVGIALGTTPKAMVKDDLTKEVYFLKEGDVIGNTGIAIKSILKDKVIIILGEEEMEL